MIFNLAYDLHGNLGKMITNQDPIFSEIQVENGDNNLDCFSKKPPNREFTKNSVIQLRVRLKFWLENENHRR